MKINTFRGAFGHRNLEEKLFGQGGGGGGKELGKSNGGVGGSFDIPRLAMQSLIQLPAFGVQATEQLFRREGPPRLAKARHGGEQRPQEVTVGVAVAVLCFGRLGGRSSALGSGVVAAGG